MKIVIIFIFTIKLLYSYTSIGTSASSVNKRSDYYNGSCSYNNPSLIYNNHFVDYVLNLSTCSTSNYFDNYSEIISLNSNPDYEFVSSKQIFTYEYTHCSDNGLPGVNGSLYAHGVALVTSECVYNYVGTCQENYIYNDNSGQCENNDDDNDGIPNQCDKDTLDYKNLDCDDDGIPNYQDTDTDGDGIPDIFDKDNEIPQDSEGSPTCAEMEESSFKKCNYNHRFECVNANPDYVTLDWCDLPPSPCELELKKMQSTCTNNEKMTGYCNDNGLSVTANTLECVYDEPEMDCSASWNEKLDTSTNQCVCQSGYTRNTFGDCWKSDIDENSTSEEIEEDNRQQDLNNEKKDKEIEDEEQLKSDNNSTFQSFQLDKTRNDTLSAIRTDINKTNELLDAILQNNDINLTEITDIFVPDDELQSDYDKTDNYLDAVINSVSNIQSSFSDISSKINDGFNFTVRSGVEPEFTTFALGQTIKVNFCDYMQDLAPIFYYIFYVSFLIIAIKIFYYGFKVV